MSSNLHKNSCNIIETVFLALRIMGDLKRQFRNGRICARPVLGKFVLGKTSLAANASDIAAKRSERAISGRHFARNHAQKNGALSVGYRLQSEAEERGDDVGGRSGGRGPARDLHPQHLEA